MTSMSCQSGTGCRFPVEIHGANLEVVQLSSCQPSCFVVCLERVVAAVVDQLEVARFVWTHVQHVPRYVDAA